MHEKLLEAIRKGDLKWGDLEAAERLFSFLALAIKETRVELAMMDKGMDAVEVEVRNMLSANAAVNFIPAIKRVRELTGMGLKESKDYVEKIRTDMRGF